MRTSWLGVLVFAVGGLGVPHLTIAQDQSDTLDVKISPEGIGTVHATLTLPAARQQVRRVLTNYSNWPNLFPRHPTIHNITRLAGRVRVDMSVPAFFVPVTLHLVTETYESQPFRIVTRIIDGDFDRYEWVWELLPTEGGAHTFATFTFHVKPQIWTPDWFLKWTLETELEEHFAILRAEVIAKHP